RCASSSSTGTPSMPTPRPWSSSGERPIKLVHRSTERKEGKRGRRLGQTMSPLATATLGSHMNPWGRPTRRRLLLEALAAGGFLAGACSAPATGGPSQPAAAGALAPGTRLSFASWGGPDVQDISKRFAQTFMEQHPGV